jgi:hypothetical protein
MEHARAGRRSAEAGPRLEAEAIRDYRKASSCRLTSAVKPVECLNAGDSVVDVASTYSVDRATLYRLQAAARPAYRN